MARSLKQQERECRELYQHYEMLALRLRQNKDDKCWPTQVVAEQHKSKLFFLSHQQVWAEIYSLRVRYGPLP